MSTKRRGALRSSALVLPPALPSSLREMVVAIAAVSALVVALLAVRLHGLREPDAMDLALVGAAHAAWPRVGEGAYFVDMLASPVPALSIVIALVVVCLFLKRWRLAAVAAIGPLGAAATTTIIKPLVTRTIHGDNLAFPSGHTAFATAATLMLGMLLVTLIHIARAVAGVLLLGSSLAGGAVMGVNQVVIGAHYPTDTIGGYFVGTLVVSATALLIDAMGVGNPRRRRAEPQAD